MIETIDKPTVIKFESIGSEQIGFISVAEYPSKIPFEIKRVYWTYNTPACVERGNHAHKALSQVIIALNGSIEIETENVIGSIKKHTLSHPKEGLYIPPNHWRKINFSENAVLLCLASMEYLEEDYIRDYNQFKNQSA